MKINWEFVRENRKALRFLLVFAGLYLLLNTVYGFYVQHYYPRSDPFTQWVGDQLIWCLRFFDSTVTGYPSNFNEYIVIANDRENMIYLYEGCNGLNVMFVYVSFLIAFQGPVKPMLKYMAIGCLGIYAMNLVRLLLLYSVAFYYPAQFFLFHKYFFTGIIYCFVFVLWFFWVKRVKEHGRTY